MSRVALKILLLFVFLVGANQVNASHSVGADIYYECRGGNNYRIYLNFYRDCRGVSAPAPPYTSDYDVQISSASCGRSFTVYLTRQSFTEVPSLCPAQQSQSSCSGGPFPGIEQHVYYVDVTLPAQCSDWIIGYDICCRNAAITNLTNPGNRDMYVETRLNNTNGLCNNAPIFTTLPTPYICAGQQYFYNHGAVDIDGDSLVYVFVQPLQDPGQTIPYVGGLSLGNPMRTTGAFQFDTRTGQMTFIPSQTQQAVVTVLVREYRNGVLIGTTMRDIQIVVLNCNNAPPISNSISNVTGASQVAPGSFNIDVCTGTQFCFDITSNDPNTGQIVSMSWNQGIPGATFTTSGNPPTGRFCWTPTVADVGPNYFVLEVLDNACPIPGRSTRSYTVNVFNSALNVSTNSTVTSCPGSSDGSASITVNNGTAPIRYTWSNGATTATINNLPAGDYTVTVVDAGNCPTVRTVTVAGPPPFDVTFDNTTAVCNGDQNGTTLATPSGSNGGPYTYAWSNGQTTAFMDSLASGLYFLTVTDADGCVFDTQTFIFQPGPLVILVSASTTSNYNGVAISCNGANDGEVTLVVTGGTMPYNYNWSPNANGQNDSIINNLGPGLYSVTLTDANNCNTGTFVRLTEPPPVVGSATTLSDISCFGANDGIASASISGGTPGYKYQWGASANNQTTAIATNLVGGFHTVTMSDTNNCLIIDTIEIIEPAQIGIDVRAITDYNGFNITCNGASDGRTKADPIGGTPPFNYQWDAAAGNQTTQIAYDVPVGTYSVTITDAGGCTATGSVSLNEPPPLGTATAITSDYNVEDVSCYEAEDGTAETTPFGGVPPYTFFWINVNQVGNAAVDLGANTYYHVTVVDANECEVFDSIILSQPPPVVVTAAITSNYNGADISCYQFSDGSAEVVNTTGGVPVYTYQWSNSQTGVTATGLSATTYTVSATDLNGCVDTTIVTLTDPEPLALAMAVTSDYNGQDISCFGYSDGSVNASASGGIPGYTYQWDASTNNQTGADALNLPTGTYNVTVTDINSCTFTSAVTVTEPPLLTVVTTSTDVVCFGNNDGTATAAANGGTPVYSYSWSSNPALNNALITGLAQGNYDVTVTDLNNCTATTTLIVNEPPLLVTGMLTDSATCFESFDGFGAVTATGGKGAYTFEWSDDVPTTDSTYSSLYHGIYTVTITDGNGCSSVETLVIGSPPPTSVSVSASETSTFFGDTVQLNAANTSINFPAGIGVQYVWNPTNDLSCFTCPNTFAFPIFTTLYEVTMIDDRGCVATDTITIHINPYDKILYVPNAFSPDGDDNNEIFYVYAAGVKSIDFKIFNRWGEKIFQSNSLDHGWDGIYKNEMMNPAVYVYYVEVTYLDDDIKAKKGSVTLIR